MATKSILYWLKKNLNIFALLVLLSGCASVTEKLQKLSGRDTKASNGVVAQSSGDSALLGDGTAAENSAKNAELQVAPVADSFLQKKRPKLGVILGAGGALAAAHVGILQELQSAKIPIHGMVGLEWGSLVGGLFSIKGQAHQAEWQILKFPHQLLTTNSIFSFGQRPKVQQLKNYFHKALGSHRLQNSAIPFACPYVDLSVEKIRWARRGSLKNSVEFCLPSAPLFRLSERSAALASVGEAYRYLKKQGADLVLFVDVLQKNSPLSSTMGERQYLLGQLWLYSKQSDQIFADAPQDFVVLPVELSGMNVSSFNKMRSIIGKARDQGRSFLEGFVDHYGF